MILIVGDYNAKIGKVVAYQNVSGKYSLHNITSSNGEKVCSLAEANQLMIMSTCFEHKWIHKTAWILPDNKTMNEVDHILVNERWKSAVQDVRTYLGPNCDSDHWMVMAKIKQRISMYYSQSYINSKKWNLEKIQDKKELHS